MSWRFRQSFKIIPGLKLNLSKSGLSASIGGAPFTVNLGPRGLYSTASLPGSGVSFRQHLSGGSNPQFETREPQDSLTPNSFPDSIPTPPPASNRTSAPTQEIRSASTELLTSESLKELKRVIQTAYDEHEDISCELSKANSEDTRTSARFKAWENGFLLKKMFKNSFAIRKAQAEIAAAKVCELEDQLRLTTISTQVELAREQAEPFFRMRDEFTALGECAAIWDIQSQQATDKVRERTIASRSVNRERVRFSLGSCELIQWEQQVPHLQNANGGDLFLYPGFILYRASKSAFSVIDCHDVKAATTQVRFNEEDGVPSDSKTIGQTWAKTNKDGSRDKRFAGNFQIPIVLYGELTFKSETGLWEAFQFSNPERLERFVKSWNVFVASFDRRISLEQTPQENLVTTEQPEMSNDDPAFPVIDPQAVKFPRVAGKDVHFECHVCRQPIEVNAEAAGQEFRCPGCGESLVVPDGC